MILRTFTVILLCLFTLGSVPAQAQEKARDPDVEKILRERLAILKEAAQLHHEAYRTGTTPLSALLETDKEVLEAELELAVAAADRVRIREEMLKIAETGEKHAEAIFKASEGPHANLLRARANRLRAAADLAIERKAAAK